MLHKYNMSGLLSTENITVLHHIGAYIFIPYRRLLVGNTGAVKGLIQSHIGHHGGNDHIVFQLAFILQIHSTQIHNVVSGHNLSVFIYGKAPVCITIVGKTYICTCFFY